MVDVTAEPLVEFRAVEKSYDGRTVVVKRLNLDVARGEFLTLLGPSGSGKTTTLMMLAGFETVTSGEIRLDGRTINALPPHKRGIGMVFQNYALFPHMTVAGNLAFPLEVRGMARAEIERRVARALDMVRLGGFAERRPAQLSGGQQQRVALARALVFEPQLVLLDEPLGALDRQLREQMQYELKHLHDRIGVTMIYVTHDQIEALTMSDRVAVFYDGALQQVARPKTLYDRPENGFVAQFIGENNRLPGRLLSRSGETCRVAIEGGGEVEATVVDGASVGASTILSLRPERVAVGAKAGALPNRHEARLIEVTFLGDQLRCRFSLFGRDDFVVKFQNAEEAALPPTGSPVELGWRVEDCRALPP